MLKLGKFSLHFVLVALLLAAIAGCNGNTSSASQATDSQKYLLFFLDPNGGPCRMQGDILNGVRGEVEKYASIRYVQTTRQADRETFYKYGIRGLPSLILIDASGKEVRRLPPGIQQADRVLATVRMQ